MFDILLKKDTHLCITCSSEFEHLDNIVNESDAFLGKLIPDDDLCYRIVLLLSEAVTNAIEHGNDNDEAKKVQIDIEVGDKEIHIRVEDEGEGFNPAKVEDPTEGENVLLDGGRGIFFIQEMADRVDYDLDGRCIHIYFNR